MNRIICLGNRYIESDSLGAKVFDLLSYLHLPPDVELIDGGLSGLNLLPFMDGCERLVFVDAMDGNEPALVQVLRGDELEAEPVYGHAAGLGYLLGAAFAMGGHMPSIFIVGAGTPQAAEAVASTALTVARGMEVCAYAEETPK
jgi:hydrogenase maturation protease